MSRIIVKLVDLFSVIDSTHIPCIISRKLKQTISVHTLSSLWWSLKYCEAHTPFRGKATTQTSNLFIYCHVEHSEEKIIVNFLFSFLGCNQPVQMLSLLVYVAAEIGALQFLKIIFTSSAGMVVFSAYRENSTLPEVIARDHGNEETANYLEDVTKRWKI